MKKIINKKIKLGLIFIISAFILQCISFLFMYKCIVPKYFFLDLMLLFILTLPPLFFKSFKVDLFYYSILMFALCIVWGVNANYMFASNDIFSLQYLNLVGEGLSVIDASMINIPYVIIIFSIYAIYLFVLIKICIKNSKEGKEEKHTKLSIKLPIISVILLVLSTASYSVSFKQTIKYEIDKKENYILELVTLAKSKNFETLGMMSYYLKELDYLYFNQNYSKSELENLCKYLTESKNVANDYTGLLNGYNVVTIMIETGISQMVNKTLTPNLYSMLNDGINCENNFCKNKTNVSEFIGIAGNYPTTGLSNNKESHMFPFALPQVLNNKYDTYYFHDVGVSRDIYSRKKLMPEIGFDHSYFHEDLHPTTPEWHWGGNYPLDSETIKELLKKIPTESTKPFYMHYTTLSMHGPYVNPSNKKLLDSLYYDDLRSAIDNGQWINPLKGSVNEQCMINYMLAAMDFDAGLGKMIEEFKSRGIFDKTLFVLYGDHDLYYKGADGNPISFDLYDTEEIKDYRLYDTVLCFYNTTLNNKIISDNKYKNIKQFTSINVIVPTILDLLGEKYLTNIYLADSIFSKKFNDPQIFYSFEISCFFNDDYLSNDGIDIELIFDENASSNQFIETMSNYIIRQSYIDKIYQQDVLKKYKYEEFL